MTSSRLRRSVLGALLACCAWGSAAAGAPAPAQPPAATGCANPRLPPAILDGAAQRNADKPLAVVAVPVGGAEVTLRLAVAADEMTRELGLMCVTRLRPAAGMLFVFSADEQQDFWMKRTLVPLDMVWVAGDGTVRSVAADVPASTLQTPDERVARRAGRGRYVLELRAGEASSAGIVQGSRLVIPPLQSS